MLCQLQFVDFKLPDNCFQVLELLSDGVSFIFNVLELCFLKELLMTSFGLLASFLISLILYIFFDPSFLPCESFLSLPLDLLINLLIQEDASID
jgi:hypothetical protein